MADDAKLTPLGKLAVLLFIGGCLGAAWWFFAKGKPLPWAAPSASGPAPVSSGAGDVVGIAYGTEKKRWIEKAAQDFAETKAGRKVTIELIPLGSLESAQAILAGDKRIHVWSPASALYRSVFVDDWTIKHGKSPILKEESLALSPMVFVFWKERYDAFAARQKTVSFRTLSGALAAKGGWAEIAGKPQWGLFKFGHTHPNQSNSGLMTLVLAAYEFHRKSQGLALADVLDVPFQTWLQNMERAMSGLSNSTGNMMKEMVLKGPSAFDGLFVYENVVIDYLKNAEGRWGSLQIAYPERNMWNENPYYILDVPWSSPAQRKGAEAFLEFLMSEAVQKEALTHGFRPGNPAVPVKFPGSPFETYAPYGLQVDVGILCEPPAAEVLQNLLASWQRSQGSR